MAEAQTPRTPEHPAPDSDRRILLVIGGALIAGILIGLLLYPRLEFMMSVWTEALGVGVTVGLFALINRWQIQRGRQQQLVDDVAGIDATAARAAVHQMARKGWLSGENGLLRGVDLTGARLTETRLRHANLRGAVLTEAELREADLGAANLSGANLIKANLHAADFTAADLRGALLQNVIAPSAIFFRANASRANLFGARLNNANLREADLKEAILTDADLRGANLASANLERARVTSDSFDIETWLPDGVYWTPGTDITRYTDPSHPDFWRSDDETSPAYYGGGDRGRRHHSGG
jgi:uncharacterized protein YjbI with pentapeptide repeats